MKDAEFNSRAQLDPSYRDQMFEECCHSKNVALGIAVAVTAMWVGYVAYCAIWEKRWPGDLGLGLLLVLCASVYSRAKTRLAALQATQSRGPNKLSQPMPGFVTSGVAGTGAP
jgi:hypothetical protein